MSETQHEKCRICNGAFSALSMGEKNGYRLIACRSCGSVMADPWPTREDVEKLYADIQPEITHQPKFEIIIANTKKTITKVCNGKPEGTTFLDVGCRQGYAVNAAQSLDMKAKGIDSFDFFIRFSKEKYPSLDTDCMTAMDYAATGQQADVIYASETFCEQNDPDAYTAALAKILAPGGFLYIEEPNGNAFNVPAKFANWGFVDPPLNFLYVSKTGIEKMLARHGLKITRSYFTWSPFMRLLVTKK